jgi:hypothetical protein
MRPQAPAIILSSDKPAYSDWFRESLLTGDMAYCKQISFAHLQAHTAHMEDNSMKLQKVGGFASIIAVCVLIAWSPLLNVAVRHGIGSGNAFTPERMMGMDVASTVAYHLLSLGETLYGAMLLLVALALQERMRTSAPNLMRLAVIAASISAAFSLAHATTSSCGYTLLADTKDLSAYRAWAVMLTSFNYAVNYTASGVFLLMGWAALRTRALSHVLSCIILICGGLTVPQVKAGFFLHNLYGLLSTAGLLWLGIVLLRKHAPNPAAA